MRLLIPSALCWLGLAAIPVSAQQSGSSSSNGSSGVSTLPVGQTYKEFQFPFYEQGVLKFTLTAAEATGITINRAEAKDLKIEIYENGKVTTTITSPDADLYVADRKLRTHHTVHIMRDTMEATAKSCDFDLLNRQYTLRSNVKVTLKNFDTAKEVPQSNASMASPAAPAGTAPLTIPPVAAPTPTADSGRTASQKIDALLESPGMFSSTNTPPAQ